MVASTDTHKYFERAESLQFLSEISRKVFVIIDLTSTSLLEFIEGNRDLAIQFTLNETMSNMFEWFFAESYQKFDENGPDRQLRRARGDQDAPRRRQGRNDEDDDEGFFSCEAILAPCVGVSGDHMLARTTTMDKNSRQQLHTNRIASFLSLKNNSVSTLV